MTTLAVLLITLILNAGSGNWIGARSRLGLLDPIHNTNINTYTQRR